MTTLQTSDNSAPAKPISFKVGPFTYTVHLVRGPIYATGFKGKNNGLCDYQQQLILISDVPCIEQRRSTFWHEMAHAWESVFNAERRLLRDEALAAFIELGMGGVDARMLRRIDQLIEGCGGPQPAVTLPTRRAAKRSRKQDVQGASAS